jgi:hypothetical protein
MAAYPWDRSAIRGPEFFSEFDDKLEKKSRGKKMNT